MNKFAKVLEKALEQITYEKVSREKHLQTNIDEADNSEITADIYQAWYDSLNSLRDRIISCLLEEDENTTQQINSAKEYLDLESNLANTVFVLRGIMSTLKQMFSNMSP